VGLLFCCMALTATEIYKLSAHKLRQLCSNEGLNSAGPVRLLRQRVVRHLKTRTMASQQDAKTPQASVSTDLSADTILTRPLNAYDSSHVGSGDSSVSVLVELMRQVPP